jgi:hypothetical protein
VSSAQPELLVVVDTEEEFDWTKPFDRNSTSTKSILAQAGAQEIFARFGVKPTYVVDYPVATSGEGACYLRALKESGQAEIGAHLHTWVTPPHDEVVSTRTSYQCNLSADLKRAKIDTLTDAIAQAFGERPTIFKAGRYGLGPVTVRHLVALGYKIDCSVLPHHDLRGDGGPDFTRYPDQPYWLPDAPGLLEVPVTTGFLGAVPRLGERFAKLFDSPLASRLHIPGMLARSGIVARSRLTPEGVPADEQCRLLARLVRSGRRTFTLYYHSPSLAPGNTPYVRDAADLDRFLGALDEVLTYFRDALGGRFTNLSEVHDRLVAERPPQLAETPRQKPGTLNTRPAPAL